ncbi:MAG: MiaB/RimO family radical SAM methylthiotransferase [Thermodesulfobacteriota bacterium]
MSGSSPGGAPARRVRVVSLGCKVNQAEAAALAADLAGRGWAEAPEGGPADLAVLFTCSVTAAAGRQSRQMARRLAREAGAVAAVGCDVQAEPAAYVQAGVRALGRAELAGLAAGAEELTREPNPALAPPSLAPPDSGPWCPGWRAPGGGRTRGLIKVQDGCDAACAYCIVPSVRGRPRSLPAAEAAALMARLGRAGAAEVVLTGIHLGRWGADLPGAPGLTALLRALLAAHPAPWLRLSSLESSEIDGELLALMAGEPRICRHLHAPLQTGSDKLLKAMGRPYTAEEYAAKIHQAAATLPGLCLGADVMVGLPGEDPADFAQTEALIAGLPLAYLHVFPYSPRPGTPAAAMPGRAPGPVAKARAARLRRLGEAKRRAFLAGLAGQRHLALVEGHGLARTGNYALVSLDRAVETGKVVEVELGRLVSTPQGLALAGRVV